VRSGAGSHGRGGTTTGGRSHCREDSGAGSHGRGNRGPEPRPGGLGGWKPRPRGPGARATAGRRSRNGGRSHAHASGGSQCKKQNTLFMEYTCPRKHTPHTPGGLSGAGSHGRGNRGPEPLPGGLGGWKPRPREPGARATAGRTRGLEATAESSRSIGVIALRAVE
jgi:hypothetical protein